jgi:excinuclease ABC subunit C
VRTITSELLRIPGVGENKRRQLLTAFGSLQGIRAATPEQIAELPGFSVKTGQRILDALRASDALAPATVVAAPGSSTNDAHPDSSTEVADASTSPSTDTPS